MPISVLFFVTGSVVTSAIEAAAGYFQARYPYNRTERIKKQLEEERESLIEAFELARDPLRRNFLLIRSLLNKARYGYIERYFPIEHCFGPKISYLERLLRQGGGTGDAIGSLISEYYPRFHEALMRTCHSFNGLSQNGRKYKLSHLRYEVYHAIFADLWEICLPYSIDRYLKLISRDPLEFIQRNLFFLPLTCLTLYIAYKIIERYVKNNKKPTKDEIYCIIIQGLRFFCCSFNPVTSIIGELFLRMARDEFILPRTAEAWKAMSEDRKRSYYYYHRPPHWGHFEIFVTGPLQIAKERGFGHLRCSYEDIRDIIQSFIEVIQSLFHQSLILPFHDLFDLFCQIILSFE